MYLMQKKKLKYKILQTVYLYKQHKKIEQQHIKNICYFKIYVYVAFRANSYVFVHAFCFKHELKDEIYS